MPRITLAIDHEENDMQTIVQESRARPSAAGAERLEIRTADRVTIVAHEHTASSPRGLVVILGAMATPGRFYRALAEHLASRGLTTIRFDYRGVGDSRHGSLRGDRSTVTDWTLRDVDAVIAFARARHPRLPFAILGHSLGGQSIGIARRALDAKAIVLAASQSGWIGHWRGLSRRRIELTWRVVVPTMTRAFGYLPGWSGMGEDVPANVAREWATWCMTEGYVTGVRRGELHYDRITASVLAWSFTDDDYAPPGSTDELLSWLTSASVEHRRLAPRDVGRAEIGHFGFFRRASTDLWDATADWLLRQLAT